MGFIFNKTTIKNPRIINSATTPSISTGQLVQVASSVAEVPLTLRGVSGQTGNLLLAENAAGTDLFTVNPSGNVAIAGTLGVTGATALSSTLAAGATTITGALSVSTTSTLSGAITYKANVIDTGGVFATPIVLTEAQSGSVILVDDAAGLDFTLPAVAAAQVGTWYRFLVTTTITSNSFRVTAAAGDLLRGGVWIADFDTANTGAYFTPDESNDLIMTMNGSTTGGKKGTYVDFYAIHATGWMVVGNVFGDGSLATPFS